MSDKTKTFYVTTPIYYVNARPHIGHAYTTIVADVLARRHRLLGPNGDNDTFFLTGTDEHGQKIERSAAAAGIPPQQFADQVSMSFAHLWRRMGITNNDYIRTTSEKHKRAVQHLFRTIYQRGHIYLDAYTGAYCVSDEAFVDAPVGTPCPDCGRLLESVTEENFFFRLSAFQQPLLDLIESNTLRITPDSARNEVLSFVKGGLKDLSISRSSFTWGIPVPADVQSDARATQKHVIYVWLDALANYITALGYGSDDTTLFDKFWPADVHLVGKEITRFHCVYWPAFLLATNPAFSAPNPTTNPAFSAPNPNTVILSGARSAQPKDPEEVGATTAAGTFSTSTALPPQLTTGQHRAYAAKMVPRQITANGWLLFDNSKMSKSKGNVVRTETILEGFGEHVYARQFPNSTKADRDLFASDVLRYFLLREIPFGQDGSFSFDAMITRYNADLANGYGNLVSRTLSMIDTNCASAVPTPSPEPLLWPIVENGAGGFQQTTGDLMLAIPETLRAYNECIETCDFSVAVSAPVASIAATDRFISDHAPWKLAKVDDAASRQKLRDVLYTAAESIRIITALLYPILPYATAKVWAQLGLGDIEAAARNGELTNLTWGGLQPGTKLGPLGPIFPRAEKGLADIMTNLENPTTPERAATQAAAPTSAPEAAPAPAAEAAPAPAPTITIDDFVKIELRIAQILVAERIPKADKLLRLEVDLGAHGQRQILSGIAEWYTPEDLIGRRIIVITNLAPRKMRGLESHGMLLAASEEAGKPFLATVPEGVPVGTRLK